MDFLLLFSIFVLIAIAEGRSRLGNGTVQFYNNNTNATSSSAMEGIVQVYLNNTWGNICRDDDFGQNEADTICYQMGYTGASRYGSAYSSTFGLDILYPIMTQLRCEQSDFQVITQCNYKPAVKTSCANLDDVTVSCYSTRIWDNPFTGMVRLTGGQYISEGLVQVYCNGQWGTMCDDGIDDDEADTICIQLGYNKAFKWDKLPIQGNSSQPIWFSNLFCGHTDKTCIGYCQSCPTRQSTGCFHSEDMTVQCTYDQSIASSQSGSRRSTCKNISELAGLTLMWIIIIAVSGLVTFIICTLIIITIPICICCCLGVGIGAAAARNKAQPYAQFD